MQCARCQFENPEGMRFCGGCGAALAPRCASCGLENPPGFNFCGGCGAGLASNVDPPAGAGAEPTAPAERASGPGPTRPVQRVAPQEPSAGSEVERDGERRLLTVMFCDLANYTGLSESLDPEELQQVVRGFQEVCSDIVRRYDGHVAQFLGDGILVYFGFPLAHEDDVRRAVLAGLEITGAVRARSREINPFTDREEAVRVGIHTGLVVTGELGTGDRRERLALGRAPNIAARLESLAEPGQVLLSGASHRLIQDHFVFDELGPHKLKGVQEPVEVFRVQREREAPDAFAMLRDGASTPFVGRSTEVEQLDRLWRRVTSGEGQIVLLMGEAGVGKSRLMRAFRERLRATDHHFLWAQASSVGDASMLGPVIEMLGRTFELARDDGPEDRLRKLERALKVYGLDPGRNVPLFAHLLDIPLPPRYDAGDMTPQMRKARTLEAIVQLMEAMAQEQPVLLVVEDLHWIDPSTQELLDLLVAQSPAHPMLTCLTTRPGFTPPWGSRSYLTMVNLNRLARSEVQEMVERVTGGKPLPREVIDQVVAKTDGVPLFVEELTKAVLESGIVTEQEDRFVLTGDLRSLSIPTTLQGSLTARLDALTHGKEVAQTAATIGREFDYDLLAEVSTMEETALRQGLDELVAAEFLYQRGFPPHASFIFKHALIQDAALASLLHRRREQIHLRVARALERRFPAEGIPLPYAATPDAVAPATRGGPPLLDEDRPAGATDVPPELIAHHYGEGGSVEASLDWWLRAGIRALERSANLEVLKHMERALALVPSLPDRPESRRREHALETVYAPALVNTRGYADAAVERAFTRVLELCDPADRREVFLASQGLWMFQVVRAAFPEALRHADTLMQVALAERDPSLEVEARFARGLTEFFMGRPAAAREHLEAAVALDGPDRDRSLTLRTGQDAGVCALTYLGLARWVLGDPDGAGAAHRAAVELAQEIQHPFSLVYALNFASWTALWTGAFEEAERLSDEVIRMSEESGFFYVTLGSVVRGRVRAEKIRAGNGGPGGIDEALAILRGGLDGFRGPGARLSQTLQLALEAEVCLEGGLRDVAMERLAEAHRAMDETQERFWAPELHRLEGIATQDTDPARAETAFRDALALAKAQGAEGHGRRAAASLAAFLTASGRGDEARGLTPAGSQGE
jgi:class 3 adenylate cyclase/tetratricopeptide (TPR) repeat protein